MIGFSTNPYQIRKSTQSSLAKRQINNNQNQLTIRSQILRQLQRSARSMKEIILDLKEDIKKDIMGKTHKRQDEYNNHSLFGTSLLIKKVRRVHTLISTNNRNDQRNQSPTQFPTTKRRITHSQNNNRQNNNRQKAKTQQNQYKDHQDDLFVPIGTAKNKEKSTKLQEKSKTQNQISFKLFYLAQNSISQEKIDKTKISQNYRLRSTLGSQVRVTTNKMKLLPRYSGYRWSGMGRIAKKQSIV